MLSSRVTCGLVVVLAATLLCLCLLPSFSSFSQAQAEELQVSDKRGQTRFHLDQYLARQRHHAKRAHLKQKQQSKLWFHLDDLIADGEGKKSLLQETDHLHQHKVAKNRKVTVEAEDEAQAQAEAGAESENQAKAEAETEAQAAEPAENSESSVTNNNDDQLGKSVVKEKKGGSTTVIANRNYMSVMEEGERKPLPPHLAAEEARLEATEENKKRGREQNHKRNMGTLRDKKKGNEAAQKKRDRENEAEASKKRTLEEVNKAQESLKKENERAAALAKKAEQDEKALRSKRCKKEQRSPSNNPGDFAPYVFEYPGGWYFGGGWDMGTGLIVGDLNGDGRDDYAKLGAEYIHIFISQGNGQFYYPVYRFPPGWNFGWDEGVWTTLKAIDMNGDKRADFIRSYHTYQHSFMSVGSNDNCWYRNGEIPSSCFKISAYRYTPNAIIPNFSGNWRWNYPATIFGDFNGDGKGDYARLGNTAIAFFISKGDGQFWAPLYTFPSGWDFGFDENGWTSRAMDFSGDCRTDIVRTSGTYAHTFEIAGEDECWKKDGDINRDCIKLSVYRYPHGWNFIYGWTWNSRAFISGDFNGDGKQDYARLGGTYIHFFISKGDGQFFFPVYRFPAGWDFTHNEDIWTTLPAADYDGDGRTDIIRTYRTYNHGMMMRGTDQNCWNRDMWIDSSCIQITTYRYTSGWDFTGGWRWTTNSIVSGDFNGDGKADYINLNGPRYNHQFYAR